MTATFADLPDSFSFDAFANSSFKSPVDEKTLEWGLARLGARTRVSCSPVANSASHQLTATCRSLDPASMAAREHNDYLRQTTSARLALRCAKPLLGGMKAGFVYSITQEGLNPGATSGPGGISLAWGPSSREQYSEEVSPVSTSSLTRNSSFVIPRHALPSSSFLLGLIKRAEGELLASMEELTPCSAPRQPPLPRSPGRGWLSAQWNSLPAGAILNAMLIEICVRIINAREVYMRAKSPEDPRDPMLGTMAAMGDLLAPTLNVLTSCLTRRLFTAFCESQRSRGIPSFALLELAVLPPFPGSPDIRGSVPSLLGDMATQDSPSPSAAFHFNNPSLMGPPPPLRGLSSTFAYFVCEAIVTCGEEEHMVFARLAHIARKKQWRDAWGSFSVELPLKGGKTSQRHIAQAVKKSYWRESPSVQWALGVRNKPVA